MPRLLSEKHVACHHFNPAILQELVINQGNSTIDVIHESFLKKIGILAAEHADEDTHDGTVGCVEGSVYVTAPSYKMLNVIMR